MCVRVAFAVLLSVSSLVADEFNYDESNVPDYRLPDPLVTAAGDKVESVAAWEETRRSEIVELFQQHVYGRLPDWNPKLVIRQRSRKLLHDGQVLRREITILLDGRDDLPVELMIYTPAESDQPVPCFLGYNFNGNHSIDPDSDVHLSAAWMRNDPKRGNVEHQAQEKSRGKSAARWPYQLLTSRGYGLAVMYYGDIDPDVNDGFQNGIHRITESDPKNRAEDAGGSISAWAWGLSQALNVLELDAKVDGKRVAVFGHSRLGKTSLWAGASDLRFALVISNNSGCGGAALSRRAFGETVKRINTSFPHWFCQRHRNYNGNEAELPVDQHMLLALMAPRPVYVASAEGDRWADPRGEFLSLFHASPVFRLFGRQALASDEMPEINQPLHLDIGYHIRSGKHDVKEFDWKAYLDFADGRL